MTDMQKPNATPPSQESRIRPGVVVGVVAVVGILVAGSILGWFRSGSNSTPESASIQPVAGPAEVPAPTRPPTTPSISVTPSVRNPPGEAVVAVPPVTGPMKAGEWEQHLDDILGANEPEAEKATKLLEMFPLLPEDGQVEVAQHLSNLLTDDRYGSLSQTFTNTATPEGVLDVLMTDVLNRANGIKLPTLLEVARMPNHPKAEEARDVLEVFVDENYGTDWAKWEKAIQDWLKENPDEPAETGTGAGTGAN
jgi:hypothetical protein